MTQYLHPVASLNCTHLNVVNRLKMRVRFWTSGFAYQRDQRTLRFRPCVADLDPFEVLLSNSIPTGALLTLRSHIPLLTEREDNFPNELKDASHHPLNIPPKNYGQTATQPEGKS